MRDEDKDKLLPCPFCGSKNLVFTNGTYVARHAHSVRCKDCGAKNGFYTKRENAITGWNRRAGVPVIAI
jgi:Lar family restriction alleviation protein